MVPAQAMIIRAILLVRKIQVVVEQPKSSTMFSMPVWESFRHLAGFSEVSTYMGCFDHWMQKPTRLFGNMDYLSWFHVRVSQCFLMFSCSYPNVHCQMALNNLKLYDLNLVQFIAKLPPVSMLPILFYQRCFAFFR